MDRQLMVNNIRGTAEAAKLYGMTIVVSSVNVASGLNKPIIPQLQEALNGLPVFDRTGVNAGKTKNLWKRKSNRPKETDYDCLMDRGLPGLPGFGCVTRRV
jgi:hypothetical protein